MFQKLAIVSYLIVSSTCMVLHPQPIPVLWEVQYHSDPNYSFAYDVHDPNTGDIKNQHESRRGDIVLGQYSLIQPDGVRRTVDYRADDHTGFQATVNNEGRTVPHRINIPNEATEETPRQPNVVHIVHPWPAPTSTTSPAPVAVSRTSIHQTITNGHNPWI